MQPRAQLSARTTFRGAGHECLGDAASLLYERRNASYQRAAFIEYQRRARTAPPPRQSRTPTTLADSLREHHEVFGRARDERCARFRDALMAYR